MDIFLSPLLLSTAIAMQDAGVGIEDDFIADLLTMELEFWLEHNKQQEKLIEIGLEALKMQQQIFLSTALNPNLFKGGK